MNTEKAGKLYGWDDGKVYYWNEEQRHEWCVSDEKELYRQLVKICREYFQEKLEQGDQTK